MIRLRSENIKAALTSPYWLIMTLSGVFFVFFALNRGGFKTFIDASFFFLILNIIFGAYPLKKIPLSYWITTAICAVLLLVSVLVAPHNSHDRWLLNLMRMLGLVFAMHCLGRKGIEARAVDFFAFLLSLAVCWQFAARYVFNMPFGTFTNQHYLASFSVLALPVIIYFFGVSTGWYKFIFIPIAILDAQLLMQTGSRAAFIGIISGTLFVLIFEVKGRRKWFYLTLVFLALGALVMTNYANMALRIKELLVNLAAEERIQLWSKAWNKLQDNSITAWIFGHGVSWFPIKYTVDATISWDFVFPHNFFLEILYLNGIVGVILVFGGLGLLFALMVNQASKSPPDKYYLLIRCLIVIFVSWLINCGLSFPFYAKYSLYPLAFILGPVLLVLEQRDS